VKSCQPVSLSGEVSELQCKKAEQRCRGPVCCGSELVAGGVCGVVEMWAQLVLDGAAWRQSVVVGWVVGDAQRPESGVGIVVYRRACGVGSVGVGTVKCSLLVLSVCCGDQRREVSLCGGGWHVGTM
jgi:hypothetical protein